MELLARLAQGFREIGGRDVDFARHVGQSGDDPALLEFAGQLRDRGRWDVIGDVNRGPGQVRQVGNQLS